MVKNLLGQGQLLRRLRLRLRAATAVEPCPREDGSHVGVPEQHVAVVAAGGQMAADEAEAGSLQHEPDGHRPLCTHRARSWIMRCGELVAFACPYVRTYLVAQQAEDAGTDAGDGKVAADVLAEGAPRPDRDEDADHLLARDAPEHVLVLAPF